jgi:gas vesicle protein
MGQTADELRREVAARRADISRDLDAIGDKVSPKQAIQRRRIAVRMRARDMKEAVMGTADETVGTMSEATESARGRIGQELTHAGEQVSNAPEMAKQRVQGNPLAAGLIAFGVGMLAASLIPESRRERELTRYAEDGLQKARGQLQEAGQEVMGELRDDAREAVEQVREVAGDAASAITDQGKEAATHVTEEARSSAEHVADEVKQGSGPSGPGQGMSGGANPGLR